MVQITYSGVERKVQMTAVARISHFRGEGRAKAKVETVKERKVSPGIQGALSA
jgi:hypothetical protein